MSIPTIVSSGAAKEMVLITDHKGAEFDVPKSLAVFNNSSNETTDRVDLQYGIKEVTLIFASSEEVAAFITTMRALY